MFFVGVRLKPGYDASWISFADDSKKTSHKQRIEMAKRLKNYVEGVVVVSSAEKIDQVGLSQCIKDSLNAIKDKFGHDSKYIYDGNTNYKVEGIETLIKGDAKVSLISAASIIAKLSKDIESERIDREYPEYGFAGHSGYVNAKHTDMIIEHGYTKYHRKSYNIKKFDGLVIKSNP